MCAGFRKQIQYRNTQNDERHTDHVHGVNFLTVDRAARNVAKDIPKPSEKCLGQKIDTILSGYLQFRAQTPKL